MNIINTVLILFILIIIINNLSNKNILNTITSYINNFKNILKNKDKPKAESFDIILNKIIIKTNKPKDITNLVIASKNMVQILEKKLLKLINNHFNKYNYKFYNLIINDIIEYAITNDGKYFKPFIFSAKVYYKNKKLDDMIFKTELFVKKDTNTILILNINIDNHNIITDVLTENNEIYNQPNYYIEPNTEPNFNNNFNNMFIHQDINMKTNYMDDNNSSLIPQDINITDNNSIVSSYMSSSD